MAERSRGRGGGLPRHRSNRTVVESSLRPPAPTTITAGKKLADEAKFAFKSERAGLDVPMQARRRAARCRSPRVSGASNRVATPSEGLGDLRGGNKHRSASRRFAIPPPRNDKGGTARAGGRQVEGLSTSSSWLFRGVTGARRMYPEPRKYLPISRFLSAFAGNAFAEEASGASASSPPSLSGCPREPSPTATPWSPCSPSTSHRRTRRPLRGARPDGRGASEVSALVPAVVRRRRRPAGAGSRRRVDGALPSDPR